jgi:four helix bundle protein
MPTYERFEELPVWKEAARLYELVDIFLSTRPPGVSRSFADQLERAALSVSNNIAEGFERGTTKELLAFIYIARGSAGEVRSMLCLLELKSGRSQISNFKSQIPEPGSQISDFKSQISDLKSQISNFKSQISGMKSSAESCSRQLRAWADKLQNSPIKGQRHLNDEVRERDKREKEYEEIQKSLLESLPPNHPLRKRGQGGD